MTSLNLNLLLGSYSQGLLIQRAQASRLNQSAQEAGSAEKAQGCHASPTAVGLEDEVKKVEPIGQEENHLEAGSLAEKTKSVLERFGESLEERLKKSKAYDPVAASATLERLVSEAADIGGALGQAKANEFMNKILVAADGQAGADSIELAIESFFAQAAGSSLANPTAYQKLEEAKGEFSKLYNSPDAEGEEDSGQEYSQPVASAQNLLYNAYVSANMAARFNNPVTPSSLGNLFKALA
ncbi:MAG: hypothetical protein LBJ61_01520 [Deltaproteobacteria bacterium]|jgi:hypothetical protein|nr:hypothetical protein [Deltaproteobacteria bacterium]